jgi:malate synthase
VGINKSKTIVFIRPRGLHLSQAGIVPDELMSASLFDVTVVAYQAHMNCLQHPLCFYIPKSESAEEALWWRDLFQGIEEAKGLPRGYIRCMALVESHPIAYQMEEFIYNLRDHLIGLNLGRWDYMASLADFNFEDDD